MWMLGIVVRCRGRTGSRPLRRTRLQWLKHFVARVGGNALLGEGKGGGDTTGQEGEHAEGHPADAWAEKHQQHGGKGGKELVQPLRDT